MNGTEITWPVTPCQRFFRLVFDSGRSLLSRTAVAGKVPFLVRARKLYLPEHERRPEFAAPFRYRSYHIGLARFDRSQNGPPLAPCLSRRQAVPCSAKPLSPSRPEAVHAEPLPDFCAQPFFPLPDRGLACGLWLGLGRNTPAADGSTGPLGSDAHRRASYTRAECLLPRRSDRPRVRDLRAVSPRCRRLSVD